MLCSCQSEDWLAGCAAAAAAEMVCVCVSQCGWGGVSACLGLVFGQTLLVLVAQSTVVLLVPLQPVAASEAPFIVCNTNTHTHTHILSAQLYY